MTVVLLLLTHPAGGAGVRNGSDYARLMTLAHGHLHLDLPCTAGTKAYGQVVSNSSSPQHRQAAAQVAYLGMIELGQMTASRRTRYGNNAELNAVSERSEGSEHQLLAGRDAGCYSALVSTDNRFPQPSTVNEHTLQRMGL